MGETSTFLDWWRTFYEKAGRHDLAKFEQILAAGETDPLRAIRLYQAWQESIRRAYDPDTDTFSFTPQVYDESIPRLPTGRPVYFRSSMLGEEIKLPYYMRRDVARFVLDFIAFNNLNVDTIVELGSGYGANLFELHYAGCPRGIELHSAEPAPDLRRVTDLLVTLDPAVRIATHPFDFRDPDLGFLTGRDSILFFTHMSVMFVPEIGEAAFLAMMATAPRVTCIHLEPVGWQLAAGQYAASVGQRQVALQKMFNQDLIPVLQGLHNAGRLQVTGIYKDVMCDRDRAHTLSVAVWQSREGTAGDSVPADRAAPSGPDR